MIIEYKTHPTDGTECIQMYHSCVEYQIMWQCNRELVGGEEMCIEHEYIGTKRKSDCQHNFNFPYAVPENFIQQTRNALSNNSKQPITREFRKQKTGNRQQKTENR